jgi:hypothetical protein
MIEVVKKRVVTPEQLALWLAQTAFSTKPSDRPRAEEAIVALRKRADKNLPKPLFVWCNSPFQALNICHLLNTHATSYSLEDTPKLAFKEYIGQVWWKEGSDIEQQALRAASHIHLKMFERPESGARAAVNNWTGNATAVSWETGIEWGVTSEIASSLVSSVMRQTSTSGIYDKKEMWHIIIDNLQQQGISPAEYTNVLTPSPLMSARCGQLDIGFMADVLLARLTKRISKRSEDKTSSWGCLKPWIEIARSCGFWWCYKNYVVISERFSEVHINERALLHNLSGPALGWRDGSGVYAVNGVQVPDFVIADPLRITAEMIETEQNIEVRRIMLDRYRLGMETSGIGAYLIDTGAVARDHDERYGTLWLQRLSPITPVGSVNPLGLQAGRLGLISSTRRIRMDGPFQTGLLGDSQLIAMLEVVNRTPEPDGHFKHYFLRVPLNMRTAHEASAWTFNMSPDEYEPIIES